MCVDVIDDLLKVNDINLDALFLRLSLAGELLGIQVQEVIHLSHFYVFRSILKHLLHFWADLVANLVKYVVAFFGEGG